jgi:hypothetical protein
MGGTQEKTSESLLIFSTKHLKRAVVTIEKIKSNHINLLIYIV